MSVRKAEDSIWQWGPGRKRATRKSLRAWSLSMGLSDHRPNSTRELSRCLLHRYFANLFRLYLHSAAYNMLARMRGVVADPPSEPETQDLPSEALAGNQRRNWHNHRRECDPLGERQPCTWPRG